MGMQELKGLYPVCGEAWERGLGEDIDVPIDLRPVFWLGEVLWGAVEGVIVPVAGDGTCDGMLCCLPDEAGSMPKSPYCVVSQEAACLVWGKSGYHLFLGASW